MMTMIMTRIVYSEFTSYISTYIQLQGEANIGLFLPFCFVKYSHSYYIKIILLIHVIVLVQGVRMVNDILY